MKLLLIASPSPEDLEAFADALPPAGYTIRPAAPADADRLGRLYDDAWGSRGEYPDVEEAIADMARVFDGKYGDHFEAASPVAVSGQDLVAATLTVWRAPWDETPAVPFINEVFVSPHHRRRGLARTMLALALRRVTAAGEPAAALRVEADNLPARKLYESLGFAVALD